MTAAISDKLVSLSDLVGDICVLPAGQDQLLSGIEQDSRRVSSGDLFMACKGANTDGRAFVEDAVARGAKAVLIEADAHDTPIRYMSDVPVIPVSDLSVRMTDIAARFFARPASAMRMIGITGTNGKTSCCQLTAALFRELGARCGVIGTLGYGMYGNKLKAMPAGPSTTPDAVTVQKILAELRQQQAETLVMEVSSHGLAQHRVNLNEFDIAMFTNLTRDHMDYHGSLENYGEVKRRLFHGSQLRSAILNLDDIHSAGTRTVLEDQVQCHTWSVANDAADVFARNLSFTPAGLEMNVVTKWGEYQLTSPLFGSFNVSNLLGVLCTVLASESSKSEFNPELIISSLGNLPAVQGRMELLGNYPVTVVVDYAHTPDGLDKALSAIREHSTGRIWCVFGCGGQRDKGKRPLMGAVAERLADLLVITDDNPRKENSKTIIGEIQSGLERRDEAMIIPDRAQAIASVVNWAANGDVVLIAGKGHEDYQELATGRVPFSDVEQALTALSARFQAEAGSNAGLRS